MATNTFVDLPKMKEAQALADYTGIQYDLWTAREFANLYLEEFSKTPIRRGLVDALMVVGPT